MANHCCLACNRSLAPKPLEETRAMLAGSLSSRAAYPQLYRLFCLLPLCAGCLRDMSILHGTLCLRCGRSMQSWAEQGELCGDCVQVANDPLCCNRSLLRYDGWVKERIGTFKYRGDERWAHCFAVLLAIGFTRHFRDAGISLLSYVPLHDNRLRERGFNQAELLAAQLGNMLRLPVRPMLQRTKETDKQSKQAGRHARQESMRDAFAVLPLQPDKPHVRKLLLIDDIYTTGSTLRSCAAAIHNAGAAFSDTTVCSLTLCR